MKRTLELLLGFVLGLCLLCSHSWASGSTVPNGYQTFMDTSGQLTLNDILSNRYANLFVPTANGDLKLGGAGTALWINVPLEHATTSLLELHNPSISRINVYLMQDELLRPDPASPCRMAVTRFRSIYVTSKASDCWSGCRTIIRSPLA